MRLADFDYDLPRDLIAQHPAPRRDDARMMILDRKTGTFTHDLFHNLPDRLSPKSLLVLNDVRVFPARARGRVGGSEIEVLFLRETKPATWDILCRPARKAAPGKRIVFAPGFEGEVIACGSEGQRTLRFDITDVSARLENIGCAPLPPYIRRGAADNTLRERDLERYQTVFADRGAAVAAPTAGLHFTPSVLAAVEAAGIEVRRLTLEVGPATFQPVRCERIDEHTMLLENTDIPEETAQAVTAAKREGRPVVAVGTTVVRTLESAWKDGRLRAGKAGTDLFIRPGFAFQAVDALLTNFHLPQSTLLMLVCAFAGRDFILRAYTEAVAEKYRFFSYGDCMLIL